MPTDLCGPCQKEWDDWSDHKIPPAQIRLVSIGNTAREVAWRRTARVQDHINLIRSQQQLIVDCCTRGHRPL